jgi:hypothetical protein
MASKRQQPGGDNPEVVVRAFGGTSNNASRQDIADDEFYWLENLMPVADGNILPVLAPGPALATIPETSAPFYACTFSISGVNYVFAAYPSNNGYIVNLSTAAVTKIGSDFPIGTTASPYNDQGLLIITPNDYFDYNVTTANTLTNQNNTVNGGTITFSNTITSGAAGADIVLTNNGFSPDDGTGGALKVLYNCTAAAIVNGGSGYSGGDNLTIQGGTFTTAVVINVTSVDGTGVIQAVTVGTAGSYSGPATGKQSVLPGGANLTGGTGTGAQMSLSFEAIAASVTVVTAGTGYAGGEVSEDFAGSVLVTEFTATAAAGLLTGGTISTSNAATSTVGADISLVNDGITPDDGTGAILKVYYSCTSVGTQNGGTGYVVGDLLTLSGGVPEDSGTPSSADAVQILVTAVGGDGNIIGIQLSNAGSYAGPETSGNAVLPGGANYTGGSGTGAVFQATWQALPSSVFVVNPGSGYAGGETSDDKSSGSIYTTITLTSSGIIGGNAISVYAGRIWLAANRTVFVSEIDEYANFGGSGTNFTISESYLHGSITALAAANNYLYIFGQDSIDALSNVVVQEGVVAFSRVNLVTGVGTISPASVFGYFRGVFFSHSTGYYLLAGASPERISEKIQGLVRVAFGSAFGCLLTTNAELNACVCQQFTDNFSGRAVENRTFIAGYFRSKWWISTLPNQVGSIIISIAGGNGTELDQGQTPLYYFTLSGGQCQLVEAFVPARGFLPWIARSKLWDTQAPLREKQVLVSALGALAVPQVTGAVTYTVDTELESFTPQTFPSPGASATGYELLVDKADGGGSQYLGLTVQGVATSVSSISLLAIRGLAERDMLA